MTETTHVIPLLSEHLDDTLSADLRRAVEEHLDACPACRETYARLLALVEEVGALPPTVEPPRDLWHGIKTRIVGAPALLQNGRGERPEARLDRTAARPGRSSHHKPTRRPGWGPAVALAALAVVLVGGGVAWWAAAHASWDVTPLAGAPRVEARTLAEPGVLHEGEWLVTDAASRARLDVGRIGSLDLGPNTRLQLHDPGGAEHRVALAEGRIHARIWAPPRQFFVETPAGLAVDLGCEYTLDVDAEGASRLHVISGYVGFVRGDQEVLVPAGWTVRARPGRAPGTPFSDAASPALRDALERVDAGDARALDLVLAEANPADAWTLWTLMFHSDAARGPARLRVYDRLAALVEPPPAATRGGTLAHEPEMVAAWKRALGVDVTYWLDRKKREREEAQS